ncbi:hypothetical protein WICPIJ_003596 [Wickerhamomyces pijperi]|uniref:Uncharacterized protein n=1 Tax=Wickerhamomyces pijperi TaxID=599730 RepID=A0A9P8Q7C6_WICPI|nr:hypothetical protein WICPIJ_003596 [Wickerhamomyces pijperi]
MIGVFTLISNLMFWSGSTTWLKAWILALSNGEFDPLVVQHKHDAVKIDVDSDLLRQRVGILEVHYWLRLRWWLVWIRESGQNKVEDSQQTLSSDHQFQLG